MNIRNVTEKDLIRALSTPCATLDKKGTVPDAQVAGQVTDVLEFATRAGFPAEGSKGKFYVDKGTGKAYEWSGTEYVESPGAPEFIRRMGVDLSRKADKVANATAGNLATLDENGNLADSGMALGDFAMAESLAPAFVQYNAYEVGDLCTSFDNDEHHKGTWLYKCILASDPLGPMPMPPETDTTHWALATVEDVLAALRTALAGKADASSLAPVATSGNYDDLRGKPGNVSAFANDAGYLTSHQQLRYAMPESVALTPSGDAATLVCADRAVTNATIASGFSTLNLTFPAEVSGYVRDFYLRITVAAGESAPALSLPQGVTVENAGGAVPEIADGEASAAATTLVWFSETAPGVFTAKSETVKAVV